MLRKLTALSVLALSLFGAKAAHAELLMLGAYDFQPFDISTAYTFSGGRGGYVSNGFSVVKAPLHIPFGKRFTNIWCQVMDVTTTSNITITLDELKSSDDGTVWGNNQIQSMSTTGAPGHVKLRMSPAAGTGTARSYECPANVCFYYAYYLTVSLPGSSNTTIKACTIEYL